MRAGSITLRDSEVSTPDLDERRRHQCRKKRRNSGFYLDPRATSRGSDTEFQETNWGEGVAPFFEVRDLDGEVRRRFPKF